MTCEHLRQLYQLCQDHELKISSSDVVRIKCKECEQIEVCPAMLTDEYEAREGSLPVSNPKAADENSG
jgi:hypothetical protein